MILAQAQTTSAIHHPATKNYAATDIKNKKSTRFFTSWIFKQQDRSSYQLQCNLFYPNF
jgi:hypothetical protein